jgi:hypothetical protein
VLNPIEEVLRLAGCEVEVLGPGMDRDGWALVVDGDVVATGQSYGAFQQAIDQWANDSKHRRAGQSEPLSPKANERVAQPISPKANERVAQPISPKANESIAEPISPKANESAAQPISPKANESAAEPIAQALTVSPDLNALRKRVQAAEARRKKGKDVAGEFSQADEDLVRAASKGEPKGTELLPRDAKNRARLLDLADRIRALRSPAPS